MAGLAATQYALTMRTSLLPFAFQPVGMERKRRDKVPVYFLDLHLSAYLF